MNIYTATDRTPYTYRIGWTKLNLWYYGVRYAKKCHPSDLWVKYFTSSNNVKRHRKIYGEPDIFEIRKVFDSIEKAQIWENNILNRIKYDQKYLNSPASANFTNWSSTVGMLCAINPISEETIQVKTNDYRIQSGELIPVVKFYVRVIGNDGIPFSVKISDERYISGELKPIKIGKKTLTGKVVIKTNDGEYDVISLDEFRNSSHNGICKNTVVVIDPKTLEKFRCDINDPRYISGELIAYTKYNAIQHGISTCISKLKKKFPEANATTKNEMYSFIYQKFLEEGLKRTVFCKKYKLDYDTFIHKMIPKTQTDSQS